MVLQNELHARGQLRKGQKVGQNNTCRTGRHVHGGKQQGMSDREKTETQKRHVQETHTHTRAQWLSVYWSF
eukprot:GDKH01007899.1.p3 GENE.GDKH01007899.1~~GDKH01007899.1.p3  ORF type:complete len:71 (-),score=0.05 GDKH01007899.1:98-310(-)